MTFRTISLLICFFFVSFCYFFHLPVEPLLQTISNPLASQDISIQWLQFVSFRFDLLWKWLASTRIVILLWFSFISISFFCFPKLEYWKFQSIIIWSLQRLLRTVKMWWVIRMILLFLAHLCQCLSFSLVLLFLSHFETLFYKN